jgi:hypothetical protein
MSAAINEELGTSGVIWNTGDLYSGYDDPQIEKDFPALFPQGLIRNQDSPNPSPKVSPGYLSLLK